MDGVNATQSEQQSEPQASTDIIGEVVLLVLISQKAAEGRGAKKFWDPVARRARTFESQPDLASMSRRQKRF
jgi:hypothetical protein